MAAFDLISRACSQAKYAAARSVGVPVAFSHRGAAAVTVYCQPGPAGIETDTSTGVLTEHRMQEFMVPVQKNFARSTTETEPITAGDQLEWQGKGYSVKQATMDSYKSAYTLTTVEHKRLGAGVGR